MEANRLREAVLVLREGHAAFPRNAEICVHLGWVSYRQNDRDRAHSYARLALDLNPNSAWAAVVAARLLFEVGAYDLVGRALRLAREKMTGDDGHLVTSAAVIAAKVARNTGRHESAEAILRDAAALDPDDQEVGLELFALLANLDRRVDALAQLEAMLSRAPADEHLQELERELRRSLP